MGKVFIDDKGLEVSVSQGIGDTKWGAFRRKPNGSLQRIRAIPMTTKRSSAEATLKAHAHNKGWRDKKSVPLTELAVTPTARNPHLQSHSPKAKPKKTAPADVLDAANAEKEMADRGRERAMAVYAGATLPATYNRDVYVQHVHNHCQGLAMSTFEIGKALIVIRENEMPDNWGKFVEDEIGITSQWAGRCMELARRFADLPKLRGGISSVKKLLAIDISDKELKEAEKTGTVLGKPIKDVDRMTVKEIMDAIEQKDKRLEQAAEQVTGLREQIKVQDEEIDKLRRGPESDEEVNAIIRKAEKTFEAAFMKLNLATLMTELDQVTPLTQSRFVALLNGLCAQTEKLAEDARARWGGEAIGPDDEVTQLTSGAGHPSKQ